MKVFNFSAGPSQLPEWVKKRAYEDFLNYQNKGFHIAEISHRSAVYEQINDAAHEDLLALYGLDSRDFAVCLMQGGATTHFGLAALNFAPNKRINIIDTDIWTQKAASEQRALNFAPNIIASSKDDNYSHIPALPASVQEADFTFICSNNTVAGTQWAKYPSNCGDLIVDASSDFLSRKIDFSHVGMMFAGAQKNAGIAGIVPVILRRDFAVARQNENLAKMMKYSTHTEAKSLYNTPPTWAVYIFSLVLKWLRELGGLDAIAAQNERQAKALYDYFGADDFYHLLARSDYSLMNVCFATPSAELDTKFHTQAAERGLIGLKGHKAKGGLRASIYNSCTNEQIAALLEFADEFKKANR